MTRRSPRSNPGVNLPKLPITVVHRSDGSGTTFLFTSYLSMQSPAWKSAVGASDSVEWPAGLGGKGNDGVAAFVKQTVGSIGYVEYAYAKQNKATYALLQNKAGKFPQPTAAAFAAAAAGADWAKAPGNYLLLLDQPGANSLADHRRDLHPGLQAAEADAAKAQGRAEVLRLGLQERRCCCSQAGLRAAAGRR